eukprot:m.4800 g.4800  ORF g.4800 m.4800 type:complete len:672 (-) comp4393_c0_seq1:17-2032(-)
MAGVLAARGVVRLAGARAHAGMFPPGSVSLQLECGDRPAIKPSIRLFATLPEEKKEQPAIPTPTKPKGFLHFLSKEAIIADESYNRWTSVPAAFLVQLSIGSVYAWSIFNLPLTRALGVVAPAAADWPLAPVVHIFSACAVSLGLSTALLGPWAERSGPRKVAVAAAVAWSTGLVLTGFGVSLHELPLLYLGYGILGGIGWGLGYISPVSTLLKWFPDRRGLASGLALTAFGGGAMLATPINESLLNLFFELPQFLGPVDAVTLVTEGGKRFAEVAGEMREVVVATTADVVSLPGTALPGVYVVGTGDTGAAKTFFTLSAGYFLSMNIGAFIQRVPREGWLPANWTPPVEAEQQQKMISKGNVHHSEALKTPQFYLLWLAVAGNATAGISVISCAKTMMSDIFATAMPAIVNGAFAASYVAALSAGNMLGRLGWANFSDWAGRKRTYFLFGLAVPTLVALPSITNSVVAAPGWLPLAVFYGSTVFLVSFYGGVFSVLPPYISDLWGGKHVGAIHGRMLTAWSAAAVAGPNILTHMRSQSHTHAIEALASKVEPGIFEQTFGAPLTELSTLIAAKTVTIPQLMQVVPAGVPDPSPTLYNTTLYSMAALAAVAMLSNAAIRPVDPKHFMNDATPPVSLSSTPVPASPTPQSVATPQSDEQFQQQQPQEQQKSL